MSAMIPEHPLKAILWDFDGTLADTTLRNLNVNRRIMWELTGREWHTIPGLSSPDAYLAAWDRVGNWQQLYTEAFGLSDEQCARAAQRWAPFQLDDPTPVPLLPGIAQALHALGDFPQAVVSQNDRSIIARVLEENAVSHYFSAIIGYAEVPIDRQKPAPDGLFRALEILGIEEPATALYIGDHEGDIRCAANANRDLTALGHELWFRSVAALYSSNGRHHRWRTAPDYRIEDPAEIAQLVASLDVSLADV
jgi:HAD superfamily hydrolase (TIGR01549 family)